MVGTEPVTYDPHDLNSLIDTIAAREVAGRLRERAAWHEGMADALLCGQPLAEVDPATAERARWYLREAAELMRLAARELDGPERGEAR